MLGVVKLSTPVPPVSGEPPVVTVYQSSVAPVEAVPERLTAPVPQLAPGVVEATVGTEFMVARTAVLLTDKHPEVEFLAST
jgi:hypothetical protein